MVFLNDTEVATQKRGTSNLDTDLFSSYRAVAALPGILSRRKHGLQGRRSICLKRDLEKKVGAALQIHPAYLSHC